MLRDIPAGQVRFFATVMSARTPRDPDQRQTAVYLQVGGEDIAFARGERVPGMAGYAALHIKILNKWQATYKGRGIGTVLAIVFAAHMYRVEGRILMSSRSNSQDAMDLWQRLVRRGLAVAPAQADLDFLLNTAEREKRGLANKFAPGVFPKEWFTQPERRFRVVEEAIEAQEEALAFARDRWMQTPPKE